MQASYTPDQARDALHYVDPGTDRATWVTTLAAAKAAGLDFDDVHAWSSTAHNYRGERDVQTAWRSIDATGPVQAGTLFHQARAGGWKPQSSNTAVRSPQPMPFPRPTPKRQTSRPSVTAAGVWEAATPATDGHPYIQRKRGRADGLRVCSGGLNIAGRDITGNLIVPVLSLSGELVSLQCIPAEGPKLNLPGHKMTGIFVVGEIVPDGRAYVVEGIGQAWACWQATGHAAVVAFGWGRVAAVTAELKTAYPGLSLVLVPDAGKESDAERIAKAQGAQWVAMPDGSPRNFDANDYAAEHGADALAVLLEPVQPVEPWPLSVAFADELGAFTPPDELVQGLLTTDGASMIYGDSNSGKTFLCIDLCCAISRGIEWMGRKTEQSAILYLAAESPASVRSRIQAYCEHHGTSVPNFVIVQSPVDLFADNADTDAVIATVRAIEARRGLRVGLIVGDTMARLSAGANENAGQDMGLVVKRMDRIRSECKAHFLMIHHTGKAAAAGARGWSGLRAAVDTEIEVTDSIQGRCAEITKQRDLPSKGERIGFRLELVALGTTKWGTAATSCVVTDSDAPNKLQAKRMGEVEGAVIEMLVTHRVGAKKAEVVKHFEGRYEKGPVYRAIKSLVTNGLAHEAAGMVCAAEIAK